LSAVGPVSAVTAASARTFLVFAWLFIIDLLRLRNVRKRATECRREALVARYADARR